MTLEYADLVNKVRFCANFSFSRWGDGEWHCILKPGTGANCDGHKYFSSLSQALSHVLMAKPPYILGMQPLALRVNAQEIHAYLKDRKLKFEWVNADVLHRANIDGKLGDLLEALSTRSCVLVGPERLKPIADKLNATLVQVPVHNAWTAYEGVLTALERLAAKDEVILYCSGMMSNVLIHDIWSLYRDSVTQIDCGSVFDPLCGLATRSYHKKLLVAK